MEICRRLTSRVRSRLSGSRAKSTRPSSVTDKLAAAYRGLTSGWMVLGYSLGLLTATHWPAHFRTEKTLFGIALDNVAHGLLYGPLAWMLWCWLGRLRSGWFRRGHRLWVVPAVLLVGAALDEWTQSFVGRSTSLADWIGDALGVLAVTAGCAAAGAMRAWARAREGAR